MKIHPTALVADSAVLADDVEIGPYCVIGDDVEIGPGCRIDSHVVVNGPTRIGENNHIYQFSSIGDDPQDMKYANEPTRLEIGNGNTIREYCTISRGTVQDQGLTSIGDDNWIMAYVHIAHDCQIGNNTIFANNHPRRSCSGRRLGDICGLFGCPSVLPCRHAQLHRHVCRDQPGRACLHAGRWPTGVAERH